MSVVGFIRKAIAAGLDMETALKMGEAFESEVAIMVPALTARQARNRRYYDSKRLNASEDKTIETVSVVSDAPKTPPSRTQVVVSSLPSLRSEEVVGGGVGSASAIPASDDWPAGKADAHSRLLVELVASPWLDPQKSPDLVTTRGRIAAWRRDGASWEHDVLPVVTGLCANRRSRVSSWKFFDAAISRSIAENRAALEIPEACGQRQTGPPRSFDEKAAAAWDYATRRIAENE